MSKRKEHNKDYKGKPKGDRHTCHVKGWGKKEPHFCDCPPHEHCSKPLFSFRGEPLEPLKED